MNYIKQIRKIISENTDLIGRDKYLNSAVLIPIININGNEEILFEKRAEGIRQGGEVSFPGGHFSAACDNNYEDTAIRETCEELGIAKEKIKLIGKLGTMVAPMGVIVEVFIAQLVMNSLDEINIDSSEVDKIFTVPLKYFLQNEPEIYKVNVEVHPSVYDEQGNLIHLLPVEKLKLPPHYAKPWKGGKHRVLVYNSLPEVIWGITAEIIFTLANRIKEIPND